MRVAPAVVACLALILLACQGRSPSPSPSPSISLTDLSSVKLATPSPTPVVPTAKPSPKPTSTPTATPRPTPTPIELHPTATPMPTATATPLPTVATTAPSASPTQIAFATPAADCVNGWLAPAAGSPEYAAAFEMIETQMGITGPWRMDEMRYFTGPDVPWILDPHYDVVMYWYVKASRTDDPAFQGRWLLEQRTDAIRGIAAVAAYESTGYVSPDWTGFVGDGPPTIYTGLPGEWSGVPYDFVTGEGDSGMPGLPDEVVGCLSGS